MKNSLLDVFFPEFCLGCKKTGAWLCKDCEALLDIQRDTSCPVCGKLTLDFKTHSFCQNKTNLKGLFWAVRYQEALAKNFIFKFKYQPFAKDLAKPLAQLLISHLLLTQYPLSEGNFLLVPIPLSKKRLRWRGFNQAEQIARELSSFFGLPLKYLLIRKEDRRPQMEIENPVERKENIKGVFSCPIRSESPRTISGSALAEQTFDRVRGKKILLIDDVCTTRATLEEAAKTLKKAGFKEIWAAVIARG